MRIYDDDLKIFLMESLRRVPYLTKLKDEILVEITYNMNPMIKEKGFVLYRSDEDEETMVTDEMIVIFDGSIEVYTMMDTGTEFSIEILPTGSILNPNNFLCNRKHSVNFRCLANCLLYFIKIDTLEDIAIQYKDFIKELVKYRGYADSNKSRDQLPLDYIMGNPNYFDQNDKPLRDRDSKRMHEIMFALKNAVIYNLLKNRRDRKIKNLKQILEEYIKKKNKLKEAKRRRKKELRELPLEEKLEKLIDDDKVLTQD